MKVKLLIATEDSDYSNFLSDVLSSKYRETIDPHTCSTEESLWESMKRNRYDIGLFSPKLAQDADLSQCGLSLLLWDEETDYSGIQDPRLEMIQKYQRISFLVEEVLKRYAKIAESRKGMKKNNAHITVVWSPAGGTGKTTVSLAYAAQCVARESRTLYLDLEFFSSSSVYFADDGTSISEALEKLSGNLGLLLQSIRRQDRGSGIYYFCSPTNYDDINALTYEDMSELINGAAQSMDEIVLDLPSSCDARYAGLMRLADRILVVLDSSQRCQAKWEQFQEQNDIFELIQEKITLVGNMGAQPKGSGSIPIIQLPYIRSDNPISVYKNLSATEFGA